MKIHVSLSARPKVSIPFGLMPSVKEMISKEAADELKNLFSGKDNPEDIPTLYRKLLPASMRRTKVENFKDYLEVLFHWSNPEHFPKDRLARANAVAKKVAAATKVRTSTQDSNLDAFLTSMLGKVEKFCTQVSKKSRAGPLTPTHLYASFYPMWKNATAEHVKNIFFSVIGESPSWRIPKNADMELLLYYIYTSLKGEPFPFHQKWLEAYAKKNEWAIYNAVFDHPLRQDLYKEFPASLAKTMLPANVKDLVKKMGVNLTDAEILYVTSPTGIFWPDPIDLDSKTEKFYGLSAKQFGLVVNRSMPGRSVKIAGNSVIHDQEFGNDTYFLTYAVLGFENRTAISEEVGALQNINPNLNGTDYASFLIDHACNAPFGQPKLVSRAVQKLVGRKMWPLLQKYSGPKKGMLMRAHIRAASKLVPILQFDEAKRTLTKVPPKIKEVLLDRYQYDRSKSEKA